MQDQDKPLTCVSCRYVDNRHWFTTFAKIIKYPIGWQCHHPSAVKGGRVDRITGEVVKGRPTDCDEMRMSGGLCGHEGKLWIPNDKKGLFTLIKKESS
jgi:hypothetical protein